MLSLPLDVRLEAQATLVAERQLRSRRLTDLKDSSRVGLPLCVLGGDWA